MEPLDPQSVLHGDRTQPATRRSVVLVVVLAIITGGCIPSHAVYPQSVGRYTRFLAELPCPATSGLFWSPQGDTLVLSTADAVRGRPGQINAIDVATTEVRVVVDESEHSVSRVTSWASDAQHFVFVGESPVNPRKQGLWVADVSGAEPTAFIVDGNGAAWSPVKRELAIYRGSLRPDRVTIDLYDLETQEEKRIFDEPAFSIEHLGWSPDGARLAFILTHSATSGDVMLLDVATRTVSQLTTDGWAQGVSWSPSGDMVVYSIWPAGSSKRSEEVHIAKIDGSCDVRVPDDSGIQALAWSPDGKYLAFSDGPRIYLYDLAAAFGPGFLGNGVECP